MAAILNGSETVVNLRAFLDGCHFNHQLKLFEGTEVVLDGHAYVVRNFLWATIP